jgi:membrane protein YqaA with SNARE-associated domain
VKPRRQLTGWRLTLARIAALLAVVGVIALVYAFRDRAAQFAGYGYPGIFLLSLMANSTLILPIPGIAVTFAMGAVFNPFGVALAAGTGAAFGELTGYMAGFSGQGIAGNLAIYQRLTEWMKHYGALVVLVLAFIPNPFFDLAGAAAGTLRMPLGKFMLWLWIGKTLKMLVFALAGANSVTWLMQWFGPQP